MGLEYLIMNSNQKNAIPCYQGSFLWDTSTFKL
jgi:hypothetical protein